MTPLPLLVSLALTQAPMGFVPAPEPRAARDEGARAQAPMAGALPAPRSAQDEAGPAQAPWTDVLTTRLQALRDARGRTLAQVEQAAADTSLEASAREALFRAADAEADRTLQQFLPRLLLTASAARLSPIEPQVLGNLVVAPDAQGPVRPDTTLVAAPFAFRIPDSAIGLRASVTVPVSDYLLRLPAARRGLLAVRDAEAHEAAGARRRVRQAAVQLFYGQLRAEVALGVAQQARALALRNLGAARARVAAGSASKAEVAALEAQVARTELLEVSTRDGAALAGERLASLVHAQPSARLSLQEDLLAPLPAPEALELPALILQALEQRSELKALTQRSAALEEQERVQRAGFLPRLDASGEVLYANPNPRFIPPPDAYKLTWQLGAQLSWGLTDALQAASGLRAAQANRAAVEAQRAALADAVRVEVFEAVQRVQSVEAQRGSAERGLAAAQEALRVRERLFEAGAGTATELLDAQNTLVGAQFAALEARVEQRRARRLLELSLAP